ncbi:hypothetical protein Bca52824_049368 [Brassica carinata]|uniref:Uncharacterized protein n=1 Tax=Brassica carinata TaxID=52824 RepID=A0A8X7RQA6_BRACI|nr:hypothetical protein Bca52824_049368 [Brassica carinata]
MEGLIPFVYRAVMQIRYGHERSSSYYVRLPAIQAGLGEPVWKCLVSDFLASSKTTSTNTTFAVSTGAQSPVHRQVIM